MNWGQVMVMVAGASAVLAAACLNASAQSVPVSVKPLVRPARTQAKGGVRVTLLSITTGRVYCEGDPNGVLLVDAAARPTHGNDFRDCGYLDTFLLVEVLEEDALSRAHQGPVWRDEKGDVWQPGEGSASEVASIALDAQCLAAMGPMGQRVPRVGDDTKHARVLWVSTLFRPTQLQASRPVTLEITRYGQQFTFQNLLPR
jgi:hypothetical protein